jgi:DNA-binding transcriptional LysR family regulator
MTVNGVEHMLYDCTVMFDKLFTQSGLSLERLKTFSEIVNAGGISAAAQSDPNRQSQFSRQLKELERYFGIELVKRGRGPMQLTEPGRRLYQIVGHGFRALEEFRADCETMPIELAIGAGESLIQWFLIPRLSEITAQRNLSLTFRNLRTEEILQGLSDASLDFGLVTRLEPNKELCALSVGKFEYCLFVPERLLQDKPKAKPTSEILNQLPLAMLEGSPGVREAVEKECARRKLKLNNQFSFSSYPQLAQAICHMNVAAIMPTLAAESVDSGKVHRIHLPFLDALTRNIHLVWDRRMADVRPVIDQYSKLFARTLGGQIKAGKHRQG